MAGVEGARPLLRAHGAPRDLAAEIAHHGDAARMLGMETRVGSLAPGKQADLVLIDARALHLRPVHDPVSTAIFQVGRGDIEAVMIAGRFRKRDGRLDANDIEAKLAALSASGHRIVEELKLRRQAA